VLSSEFFQLTSKNQSDVLQILKVKKLGKSFDDYDVLVKNLLQQFKCIEKIGCETEKIVQRYLTEIADAELLVNL